MTDPTPHRATPDQWGEIMHAVLADPLVGQLAASFLTELVARVEALGGQQQDQPPAAPEPDDSLVQSLADEGYGPTHARAASLAVARWLRANGFDAAANRLEREAGR